MNARANTILDGNSLEVRDKTTELLTKAHAILDLIRCTAKTSADPAIIAAAAWAAQEMLEDANQLNRWF